jgi:glycosyltransferase involved in cell wall biosynthesis
MIVDGLGLSGKTKAFTDLAVGLDKKRYSPTVLCFNKENSPLVGVLERARVPVIELPIVDRLGLRNAWRMLRVISRVRPDIVHCYNPRTMLYGGLAARMLRIRSTIGTLSAFACTVPDREYDFLPQPLSTTTRSNRFRNKVVAGLMQRLAVVSLNLGERFCKYNGISVDKLRLVPYGVPLGDAAADAKRSAVRRRLRGGFGMAADDIVVGSVGRLVEQKDYPTQLAGFAKAAAAEGRLRMVLAGDGPLRRELEALVAKLGIAEKVRFLGYRPDVADLLQAIDIFALTSKFEPLGVALLEAKAFRVPIVAAAVNEIPGILSGGASGLLFERGSAEGFASALTRLAHDSDLREQIARRAFEEAQTKHSLAAMIASYENLYEEVNGALLQ